MLMELLVFLAALWLLRRLMPILVEPVVLLFLIVFGWIGLAYGVGYALFTLPDGSGPTFVAALVLLVVAGGVMWRTGKRSPVGLFAAAFAAPALFVVLGTALPPFFEIAGEWLTR